MTELRKLIKQDILDIRDNLIEPGQREVLTDELAQVWHDSDMACTYLRDGSIVGCCGGTKVEGVWQMWAAYAKGFPAMTIGLCAKAFGKVFRKALSGQRGEFGVSASMCHLERYAKFLGGVFVRKAKCSVTGDILNIYEVA